MNQNDINKLGDLLLQCASYALENNTDSFVITLNIDDVTVVFNISCEIKKN